MNITEFFISGVFGLTYCSNDQFINYFLICDGTLSVFLFPITIMEWSSHIGGCNSGGQKQTMKDCFCSLTILIFRLGAAVCGKYRGFISLATKPKKMLPLYSTNNNDNNVWYFCIDLYVKYILYMTTQ